MEIKFYVAFVLKRRTTSKIDACSMASAKFLTARRSQRGHVIAEFDLQKNYRVNKQFRSTQVIIVYVVSQAR